VLGARENLPDVRRGCLSGSGAKNGSAREQRARLQISFGERSEPAHLIFRAIKHEGRVAFATRPSCY